MLAKLSMCNHIRAKTIARVSIVGNFSRIGTILLIFLGIGHACEGGNSKTGDGGANANSNSIPTNEKIVHLEVTPHSAILLAGQSKGFELIATTDKGKLYYNIDAEWQLNAAEFALLQSGQIIYAAAPGTALLQVQRDGVQSNTVDIIIPGDPLFPQQWHLKNIGQNGGLSGTDVNVEPVWRAGLKGQLSHVVIVDDGIELLHRDLIDNLLESLSWNYITFKNDPTSGVHGTSVAGIVGARDGNNIGGTGIAPRVPLLGYNLLENYNTINEADAMTRHSNIVAVSNNSWGAIDSTGELFRANESWHQAVRSGATKGRAGLGVVYVWAAGNGGRFEVDDSNFDGQANSRYVMAIAAFGDDGVRAGY